MRIGIVSATWRPGFSYQENIWAEVLAEAGHAVRLFTARAHAEPPADFAPGPGRAPYQVERVRSVVLPRNIFFTDALADAILGFAPDAVVWMGLPHFFGRALFTDPRLRDLPLLAISSLNRAMHAFDWGDPGPSARSRLLGLAFHLLRSPDVVAGCLRADVVVANTPDTADILLSFPRGARRAAVEARMVVRPMGFDPRTFRWDPAMRARVRRALGLGDEVVAIVASRFAPEKEASLNLAVDALRRVEGVRPLLVGADDGPVTRRVKQRAGAGFTFLPFADRARLAELYHAADLAVFARPSITVQETLGTGLLGVLPDDNTLGHLVREAEQAVFVRPFDRGALVAGIETARARRLDDEARGRRAAAAAWLRYDRIIFELLDRLLERRLTRSRRATG